MKEKRQLKPEQANAARTLGRHVSVTAGPGSGKTTVLVERYLHILRENKNLSIDQIVAITFTNRAANEMRERLRKDLDVILAECSGDERQRWMRYKRTLDGAVISTIHGFCARLLREFPVEARIDPQFLLLDQHDAAILLEASVEETLTEFISKERELVSALAVGFGRSRLAEVLVRLYRDVRGQGLNLDELAQRTLASHATVDEHKHALAELDQAMNDFLRMGRLTAAAEEKRSYAHSNWNRVRELIQSDQTSVSDYCAAIEAFRAAGRPDKRSALVSGMVGLLDELFWGANKAGPFGHVPQICFDLFAKEYAHEMIHLLKEVERRYRDKKQKLTAVDFDDLQLRALELLSQPAVLARVTGRYRYFLVDEFQDTNSVQRELMHRLALNSKTKEANLFIVGDRKQSIYGFRGADVDVFQQTTETLKAAGGIEQPLHLNFRSQPALIHFFNHLFPRLFQLDVNLSAEALAELGYVEFEPGNAQREQEHAAPLVELLIDTKALADEDPRAQRNQAERDAKQVAQRIRLLTDTATSHDDNKKTAPVEYRDIALLFPASTDVPTYENVLRNAHIPFQTVQGKGFYEREEITDLIQLLRFLDNTTDELALAAILRSPLGGISDNALLALRCAPWLKDLERENHSGYFGSPRKLFTALRRHRDIAYIDEQEHEQLDRTLQLLSQLIERRNHSPLAELLRFAVDESEYLSVIAANFDGAQRLANVHKLFTLAERFEHAGAHLIRDLVRYVEEFEEIGSREGEGQIDDSANAVRLMTIHQAKGLEFPVVIIPNLHHRSMKPQDHWFALDRHRGLTVKIPDGRGKHVAGCTLETFRERSKLREHLESIRLLYVAATRAEDRLILAGATNELSKLNGSADSWLKLIWQKLELAVSRSGIVNLAEDVQLEVILNLADEPLPQPAFAINPDETPHEVAGSLVGDFPLLQPIAPEPSGSHRFSVTQLINYRRCPRQYYFDRILHVPSADEVAVWNNAEAPEPPANLTATLKGAVIHRFCETYAQGDQLDERLRQSFSEVVSSRRAQLADRLTEIDADQAIKEMLPLAENYLGSELFKRVESARVIAADNSARIPKGGSGLWSELSFRLKRPLGLITGTIDKLLVSPTQDGGFEIEIIDFKTNKFVVSSVAAAPDIAVKTTGPARAMRKKSSRAFRKASNQFSFDFSEPALEPRCALVGELSLEEQVRVAATDYQLQMQAYALAVRQLIPELAQSERVTVALHFLQPNIEYHLSEELLRPDVCAQALDGAMQEIIAATEPTEFPVCPATHCRMCNFLEICSSGREWLHNEVSTVTR